MYIDLVMCCFTSSICSLVLPIATTLICKLGVLALPFNSIILFAHYHLYWCVNLAKNTYVVVLIGFLLLQSIKSKTSLSKKIN